VKARHVIKVKQHQQPTDRDQAQRERKDFLPSSH
jgi:hypothetical protein